MKPVVYKQRRKKEKHRQRGEEVMCARTLIFVERETERHRGRDSLAQF